jgi:hypothetical protein
MVAALAAMALAVSAPAGWAQFGFASFGTTLGGAQATQAGGHADITTEFAITSKGSPPVSDGDLRTLIEDLPPGFLGNPNATPKCTLADFNALPTDVFSTEGGCPASTQVGVASTLLSGKKTTVVAPVFNMEPRAGQVAGLAFLVPGVQIPVHIGLRVRTESDYGVTAILKDAVHLVPVVSSKLTLWASPSDKSHDKQRFPETLGDGTALCGFPCIPGFFPLRLNPGLPPRPYLSNPTRCGEELTTQATAWAYGFPNDPDAATSTLGTMSGCDLVPFQPWLDVTPGTRAVDTPSRFDVELAMPPSDDLTKPDQSHLRRARVTLPEGVSINPSSAQGLQACTDDQLNIGTSEPAECPDASKVGTVEIESAPLPGDHKLTGHLHVRPQLPDETFRVAVVAEGHGVNAKIPGVIRPDESTGQIVGLFEETPQVPFTRMTVRLDGGARAPLATPLSCGPASSQGIFTPWSGNADVTRLVSFDTSWDGAGAACPAKLPFEPSVSAGSRSAVAGSKAAFVIRAQRPDRNQELKAMVVETPKGLSAYLRGVPVCSAAQGDAGTCSEASRVGAAVSGAGAGTHPFYLGGKVFLTEGYKGGEYGLSIVVPAIAGPFDLGDVVVRAAIHVDRTTAELRVESDSIPRIIEGVPLRLRDIRIEMDRPGFTVNPTSCKEQDIVTRLESYGGAVSTQTTPMQMGGCSKLRFTPKHSLRVTGSRSQMRTNGHPGVRASLRHPAGQAGIKREQVTLPKTLALDPNNAQALCENADGIKEEPTCPEGSIVGRARAVSPLLNRPLAGNVYFVKGLRRDPDTGNMIRTLPMLVIALRGEVPVNLVGRSSVRGGHLVTTFRNLPDVPISRFNLRLQGGSNGILVVTDSTSGPLDLCSGPQIAGWDSDAHNGRIYDRNVRIKTPCGRKR